MIYSTRRRWRHQANAIRLEAPATAYHFRLIYRRLRRLGVPDYEARQLVWSLAFDTTTFGEFVSRQAVA